MEADRTFAEWSRTTPRIKWSAVFAGWAVGLALQIVLTLAGLGFGAWTIDLHDANPADDIPVGAALWTGLSMLVSTFLGGYLTARLSGSSARGDGLTRTELVAVPRDVLLVVGSGCASPAST